jgi:hypothetical protein
VQEREQKKGRRGAFMQGFESFAAFDLLVIKHIANLAPNAHNKYTPAAVEREACAWGVQWVKI